MHQIDPLELFPGDYRAARAAFLAAAADAGFTIRSERHPGANGPGGHDLHMDMATAGPEGADALVVISGTHGPEGHCGSGIQAGLLRSGAAAGWAQAGLRVVLVHAHNPYGFAWNTRFNEENIDLNRNYVADWSGPLPANPGYDALAHAAAPPTRDAATLEAAQIALMEYTRDHGYPALQHAMTAGQYRHPQGMYFGGTRSSWSRLTLKALLRAAVQGAHRVVVVDMHTGLGPSGHGEIICSTVPGTPAHAGLQAIWGDEIRTTADGSSVSADLEGTLDVALRPMLAPAQVHAVALEFGTEDPLTVFRATQASSWLHVHGDPEGPDAGAIRAECLRAFFTDTPEWKRAVWTRGHDVVARGADWLLHR
jgi:hypothetical protein